MAAVLTALLVGILTGALLRPFVDSYLSWRTARMYASQDAGRVALDEALFHEPLR